MISITQTKPSFHLREIGSEYTKPPSDSQTWRSCFQMQPVTWFGGHGHLSQEKKCNRGAGNLLDNFIYFTADFMNAGLMCV
ncbi:hypothetical protein HanIR_Chr04g0175321 [Helianthus annuus]|nr:hypothetical protein HanIR_Chr04g0175321 [Helianthus annuus]